MKKVVVESSVDVAGANDAVVAGKEKETGTYICCMAVTYRIGQMFPLPEFPFCSRLLGIKLYVACIKHNFVCCVY